MMPLGDSITAGPYYRQALYHLRPDMYAVGSVEDVIYLDYPGDRFNEGHGGWTSAQILVAIPAWYAVYRPRIVCLLIGANDALFSTPPNDVIDNIIGIVSAIHALGPDTFVFVGTTTNFATFEPARNVFASAYAALILSTFVDYPNAMAVQMPFFPDDEIDPDGIHPNIIGAPKIGAAFAAAIETILGPVPPYLYIERN